LTDSRFPIVGIGASAGGTQALEALFRRLPTDIGMAFFVVMHLPRNHESLLPEIIGRVSKMPVAPATNDGTIERDHVYIGPADRTMMLSGGRIHLEARGEDRVQRPIDVSLSSLAEDQGEAAVGILLSGAGSDGALGMKAIKERGGLTIAQTHDGSGPLHDSMPEAAIASGVIDLALPVEAIAERLIEYGRSFSDFEQIVDAAGDDAAKGYEAIYQILLKQVGHDFSGYKSRTFHRRVRRRMQVLLLSELGDYVKRLRAEANEVNLLFRDLLIGVTDFFRDKDAFAALEDQVVPRLFTGKGANDSVRIWVPGCATGEEVYSLAILVREQLDKLRSKPKVQIFATDIDENALTIARGGRYPGNLLDGVTPERLQRFFTADDASYTVNKELRDLCVFSPHSVLRDPPFSRIDLISCRNLLIYLGSEFQAQVIPVFHFALRPGGFLFLGTSENVSQHTDLFSAVDKKHRLFQRRDHLISPVQIQSFMPHVLGRQQGAGALRRDPAGAAMALRRAVDSRMIERHAPAHVVVNRDGDILHYSPRTGKYLEPAVGLPSRQLLSMARKGLRLDLRAALREAVETRRPAERNRILVDIEDRQQLTDVVIEPLDSQSEEPLFLVLFRDVGGPFVPSESEAPHDDPEGNLRIERLEQELHDTRERLRATIEEYETAVEELKSSNEELQSVNEELQSTNEELETSKEELQSLNEELHTVNSELNGKIEEIDNANADLRNVFESTQIATVFLDQDLVIRTFTPAVGDIFNLIPTDRGRPLTDIVSHLEDSDMRRDIQTVLERGEPIERNIRRKDGQKYYLMRMLPYRAHGERVEGVLVTFVDVTTMVESERQQRTLVEELNHRVRNMLTVVNAIAQQTLKQTHSPEEFAAAFTGRIQAMAAAHTLVSRQNWGEVALKDVISSQLNIYGDTADGRIEIDGPPVLFAPAGALTLSLVMHELATNAVKHGALRPAGKGGVSVSWAVEGTQARSLVIAWRERGGAAAKKPSRRGFGTELIEREVKASLGGSIKWHYGSDGFAATLSVPFDRKMITVPA
jgi:two-component system CheB/CheR fusion protein